MVLTQLQLKWPNHSTQLLSGLKSLFKNEQLVDCTLKCNKHTLKVHRSVLAACSPYFERELENNPLVVIKDMQFNVLQALIEFMYYGETRITEENLTSLIEAAKLFEIKGLSEMDLLTSSENSIVPSVVAVNKNCKVESSFAPDNMNDLFENNLQTIDSALKSPVDEALSVNVPNQCLSDGDDSNSNLIGESAIGQSHSNRNFVITPPQTESAQILLSLAACSYSQKQYLNPGPNDGGVAAAAEMQNGADERLIDHHHNLHANLLFDEPPFILSETITSSSSEPNSIVIDSSALPHAGLQRRNAAAADSLDFIDAGCAADRGAKQNGVHVRVAEHREPASVDCGDSLLAKLLTRANPNAARKHNGNAIGGARYETLYDAVEPSAGPTHDGKNVARMAAASTACSSAMPAAGVELPAGLILECPFLIETNTGYLSVENMLNENMLNVLENEIFAPHAKNTVKIIPKEEVVTLANSDEPAVAAACLEGAASAPVDEPAVGDALLERIRQDTADELRDDPEAVVLTRVADDGRLETFVLSSADVKALRHSNEQRRRRRKLEGAPATPLAALADVELCDAAATSLITRVLQLGAPVDDAIARLPFRRSSRPPSSLSAGSGPAAACAEPLLADAAFDRHQPSQPHHPSDHHHENMFEELDSQFNMDCSIEHMQRDYVAYEEASKNETQLEHNYYANALKDEDEECVAISGAEGYMMLLEQPLTNGNGLAEKGKSAASSYHRHIIGATDVYLSNVAADKKEASAGRRNGLVIAAAAPAVSAPADKSPFDGKTDLIANRDALMSSAMAPSRRLANGASKKSRAGRAAAASCAEFGANTLPFTSVKNAGGEKKPRRTYKRKATGEANSRSTAKRKKESVNGGSPFVDAALVEEIVVDEIS